MRPWIDGPFVSFDTETTGVSPEEDRIVTATVAVVGRKGVVSTRHWMIDPGVEIPEAAAQVHGITTQRARAEGRAPKGALAEIRNVLGAAVADGHPVIAMNAAFDLSILEAELHRHGLPGFYDAYHPSVIDPLVIDRAIDRYRRGKRRLEDLCRVYGVRNDGAHDAGEDALAAARVVWRMAHHEDVVTDHGVPVIGTMTLSELMKWQALEHRLWAQEFESWLRGKKAEDGEDPSSVVIEREWPIRLTQTTLPSCAGTSSGVPAIPTSPEAT